MSKKKVAVILASTVLIASLVIGGTLAYLTSNATVTNTFTMGDVKILLTEPAWVSAKGLDMLPGATVPKDPTVTEDKGSSYMRIKMEIVATDGTMTSDRISLIKGTIAGLNTGVTPTKFTLDLVRPTTPNIAVSYYNYNSVLLEGESATLFTSIAIPGIYTNANIALMGKYSIKLTAEAIQSGNLDQAAAYTALDAG